MSAAGQEFGSRKARKERKDVATGRRPLNPLREPDLIRPIPNPHGPPRYAAAATCAKQPFRLTESDPCRC